MVKISEIWDKVEGCFFPVTKDFSFSNLNIDFEDYYRANNACNSGNYHYLRFDDDYQVVICSKEHQAEQAEWGWCQNKKPLSYLTDLIASKSKKFKAGDKVKILNLGESLTIDFSQYDGYIEEELQLIEPKFQIKTSLNNESYTQYNPVIKQPSGRVQDKSKAFEGLHHFDLGLNLIEITPTQKETILHLPQTKIEVIQSSNNYNLCL